MNKSPDQLESHPFNDDGFAADLAREERIEAGVDVGKDIELSADLALKGALSQLTAPALPDELRARVMAQTRQPAQTTAWFAMAAAIVLSVVVVMALNPFTAEHPAADISAEDWAQLSLAIETLNRSGEQIAQVTTREVGPHLALPRFEMPRLDLRLEPLPYPNSFRRWFQPSIPQSQ